MANEFQSLESGKGLLKQSYSDLEEENALNPLQIALKRRREKLAKTKLGSNLDYDNSAYQEEEEEAI